jgi:catechol 2,3-dioxygenase-like lactoylglutathione lyase family enzyme
MAIKVEGLTPLIQVFDMPRSVAFYRDVLGFEVVTTSPERGRDDFDWAMLTLHGTRLMLNTAYEEDSRPAKPDASRASAHADTGLFFSCRDVDAVYSHLCGKGVNVEAPHVAPYGMKQLYVTDPDGYAICFQCHAE